MSNTDIRFVGPPPGLRRESGETDSEYIERLHSEVMHLQLANAQLRLDMYNIGELARRALSDERLPLSHASATLDATGSVGKETA